MSRIGLGWSDSSERLCQVETELVSLNAQLVESEVASASCRAISGRSGATGGGQRQIALDRLELAGN